MRSWAIKPEEWYTTPRHNPAEPLQHRVGDSGIAGHTGEDPEKRGDGHEFKRPTGTLMGKWFGAIND